MPSATVTPSSFVRTCPTSRRTACAPCSRIRDAGTRLARAADSADTTSHHRQFPPCRRCSVLRRQQLIEHERGGFYDGCCDDAGDERAEGDCADDRAPPAEAGFDDRCGHRPAASGRTCCCRHERCGWPTER